MKIQTLGVARKRRQEGQKALSGQLQESWWLKIKNHSNYQLFFLFLINKINIMIDKIKFMFYSIDMFRLQLPKDRV
jgi:hypothetical protein